MKLIEVGPVLHRFDTVGAFLDEFRVGEGDLIFSVKVIYDAFLDGHVDGAQLLLVDKYGTTEPTDEMIDAMIRDADLAQCHRVIAIGGGAVMDIAKVVACSGGLDMDGIFAQLPDLHRDVELVLVPTTCGTGSEVTQLASINRIKLGTKVGMGCPAMYGDSAVLIPELLHGLPNYVFATSSIDALCHAVESILSPNSTPVVKLFGYQAVKMILSGYRKVVDGGLEARNALMGDFLLASTYAGIAFGTGGCAAVHALSYQLGGKYHVAHGESNYALFSKILEMYDEYDPAGELGRYKELVARCLGCSKDDALRTLDVTLQKVLPLKPLHEYGFKEEDIKSFPVSVEANQQRLITNSYRPWSIELSERVYRECF